MPQLLSISSKRLTSFGRKVMNKRFKLERRTTGNRVRKTKSSVMSSDVNKNKMIQHAGMQRGDGPTRWPIMRARLPVYHLLRVCSLRPRLHNHSLLGHSLPSRSRIPKHPSLSPTSPSLLRVMLKRSHRTGRLIRSLLSLILPYFSRSFPSRSL